MQKSLREFAQKEIAPNAAMLDETAQFTVDNLKKMAAQGFMGIPIPKKYGGAQAAYEEALNYAQSRRQFGQPIFNFQAIAFKLADMATQIEAARLLVIRRPVLRCRAFPAGSKLQWQKCLPQTLPWLSQPKPSKFSAAIVTSAATRWSV